MKAREVPMINLRLCMEEQLEKLLKIKSGLWMEEQLQKQFTIETVSFEKKYSKKKKDLHMFFIN